MSFERAKAAVSGTRFADLRWVAETGSTNADVLELLTGRGAADGSAGTDDRAGSRGGRGAVVLVTDHQTAGRGRLQRAWEAPPGTSVLMSIGLPVDGVPASRRTLLTTALALAVTDAQPALGLKWPNDLVVPTSVEPGAPADPLGYRKVGGILAESHRIPGVGEWVVLGIGLNVNWPEVPEELIAIATSIDRVVGHEVDREELVAATLAAFDARWLPLVEGADQRGELLAAYRERSATIGGRVRVELADGELLGTATDVTAEGALVVTGDDGVARTVTVGDVVHLRPVG